MGGRLTLVAAAAALGMVSLEVLAQSPAPAGSKASNVAVPRMADGTPDLRGVWMPPYVPDMSRNGRDQRGFAVAPFTPGDTPQARQALYATGDRAELPFTAWGLQEWVAYDAADGDYTGSCFPMGLVRSMNTPYPFQIMQDDRHVALLFESNTWHHVIPLNKELPADLHPQWFGHSVGRWAGDTLIVETGGFNGYTKLDTIGHPHSERLHVTQTFTPTDEDHIAYTMTIADPKTYTVPWKNERVITRIDGPLIEYSCQENNRSLWDGRIKPWTPPWVNER
jgi:hypothetical protein